MKAKGLHYHCEMFPERAKVLDKLHDRRKWDKPIDGRCFKDAGDALKEMKVKGVL